MTPRSTRSCLGLSQNLLCKLDLLLDLYITFLPFYLILQKHTTILTLLTTKSAEKPFPSWMDEHQQAFDSIKKIVVSHDCLTTIDFWSMPENKIYVTTDASDTCSGALLSFGPTWESTQPVAFNSSMFKGAELNYPVHKKELLAIIWALKKWWSDLIGSPFFMFTDHKTLENFHIQRDLSHRQARWMEFFISVWHSFCLHTGWLQLCCWCCWN